MSNRVPYTPSPITNAHVDKDGDKWTLILTRDLRHSPARVWEALTEPGQLGEWAPFTVSGSLTTVGATISLTWVGTGTTTEATVKRADVPVALEYADIRWELEPTGDGSGTRLKLWHSIDRRFIAWGAAGWHICLDVLLHLLDGEPIGRLAGADAMKFSGWQQLTADYAAALGATLPTWQPPSAAK